LSQIRLLGLREEESAVFPFYDVAQLATASPGAMRTNLSRANPRKIKKIPS
jgi:hypothetical protein